MDDAEAFGDECLKPARGVEECSDNVDVKGVQQHAGNSAGKQGLGGADEGVKLFTQNLGELFGGSSGLFGGLSVDLHGGVGRRRCRRWWRRVGCSAEEVGHRWCHGSVQIFYDGMQ